MIHDHDTIAAPATAPGGAIAVIRVSGDDALTICDRIFRGRRPLASADGYTVHYGHITERPGTGLTDRSTTDPTSPCSPKTTLHSTPTPVPSATCGQPADGSFTDGQPAATGERIIDDVLVTVFRAPRSYTGENSVEISCHGSQYVVAEILRLLNAAGARMAEPGEFTVRAYLNGKMDLSQAEAVADIIAASSRAAHALAANQMRGGYSARLEALREQLVHLASLLELELDFSEEEVEFADRTQLRETMQQIAAAIDTLCASFSLGNAIKQGVSVAIVGAPNVGKSTLLNRLLEEDRALVSDIAGTTRDVIEETANIDGVQFRFLDTAGIRSTDDTLEKMGIERTLASLTRAQIVIYMLDAARIAPDAQHASAGQTDPDARHDFAGQIDPDAQHASAGQIDPEARHASAGQIDPEAQHASAGQTDPDARHVSAGQINPEALPAPGFPLRADQHLLTVVNKTDLLPGAGYAAAPQLPHDVIGISAKKGAGINLLRRALRAAVDTEALYHGDAIVSNSRHAEALTAARGSLREALTGLDNGLPTDLLSEEIREVIRRIGTITGRGLITPDEILKTIFSKFCIGK